MTGPDPMTTLTPAQTARLAEMDPADRQCWAHYFQWKNEEAAEHQRAAERAILGMVAKGEVDPADARRAAGVPVESFNAAVRLLKFAGSVAIDEAGMLVAG